VNSNVATFDFLGTIRQLRVLVPPVWSVKVRRVRLADFGDCSLVVKVGQAPYYSIRVNRELRDDAQIFVLLHEWAHALSWGTESHRVRAHGPEWGIAMSRIWQALMED